MTNSPNNVTDPFGSQLAGRRLGRYEVLTRLASGGMASVYVARGLGVAGFERLFAVKVLHPHLAHEHEFISMFLDEARLAARIRHPNVVSTIDISDSEEAGYYLVMDYIEGDHLGALLQHAFKQGSRLPVPVALRIVIDTLEGLAAAHELTDESGRPLNLVHRDISPHNIMVSTDGIARLTDFGVAKAEFRLSTTRDGQFKGKLAYMSPEHASDGQSDQRSDLFAMAIILWESLTGRRLFRSENHAATLNKICLEPIPDPSAVDTDLSPFDAILKRGLARDPAARFQTAHEFAETLEEAAEALGGIASPRRVGKLVKEFAQEKISRDEKAIREAIGDLAKNGAVLVPEESGPLRLRNAPAEAAVQSDAASDGSESEGLADQLEPVHWTRKAQGNRKALGMAALLFGLAGAAAATTLFWSAEPEPNATQSIHESASAAKRPPGVSPPTTPDTEPNPPKAAPAPAGEPEGSPTLVTTDATALDTLAQPPSPPAKPGQVASPATDQPTAPSPTRRRRKRRSHKAELPSAEVKVGAAQAKQPAARPEPRTEPVDEPPRSLEPGELLLNPYR